MSPEPLAPVEGTTEFFLGRMDAKLDALRADLEAHRRAQDSHHQRITRLESTQHKVAGAAAVVGAALSQFIPLLAGLLHR